MKKTAAILIAFFFASAIYANSMSSNSKRPNGGNYKHSERKEFKHPGRTGNNHVGAPLDGGLLTVLGVAGVAYYASRKKKRNPEE